MRELSESLAPFLSVVPIPEGERTMARYEDLPDVEPHTSSEEESEEGEEESEEEESEEIEVKMKKKSSSKRKHEEVESESEIEASESSKKTRIEPGKFVLGVDPSATSLSHDIQRTMAQLRRAPPTSLGLQGASKNRAGLLMKVLTGRLQ